MVRLCSLRGAIQRKASLVEASLVLCVLIPSVVLPGCKVSDILAGFAVFLTFLCSQNAFEMTDRLVTSQAKSDCSSMPYRNLYVIKEMVWIVTFMILGNVPLIASTFVFISYPCWRKWMRKSVNEETHTSVDSELIVHFSKPLMPEMPASPHIS